MRYSKRFRVKPGHKVKLADIDPGFHSTHEDEAAAKGEIVTNQSCALYNIGCTLRTSDRC